MNQNLLLSSINTDRDLASILDQFSEDSIESIIVESLKYKFAPYADRKPNLPYVINNHFIGIRNNYTGSDHDTINTKEYNTYLVIINKICEAYNLQLINEVPYESAYSLAYALYQILISEFTDRLLLFYSNYIFANRDNLLAAIPDDQKVPRSSYTKKMYSDPKIIDLYENMDKAMDLVASLDFELVTILEFLSDKPTAEFICNFIADVSNLYKNHIASYVRNQITRTDMLTSIKINYASYTASEKNISATNNQYMV